jgi:choline dehydrogenase-like flavoprotein
VPYSGWPIAKKDIARYVAKAYALCEAGELNDDAISRWASPPLLPLGTGGITTHWLQFSQLRGTRRPIDFGERYTADLKKIRRLKVYLQANVTRLGVNRSGSWITELTVATLTGKTFKVRPKAAVLALGAIETARLMLASNAVEAAGVGNGHDQVGRFFADHPCPRDAATLVKFDGKIAPYYLGNQTIHGATVRAGLFPSEAFRRDHERLAAAVTVEGNLALDDFGKAAVAATANALGVDARNAAAHALNGAIEIAPDPDRRVTLTRERDALGVPKVKPHPKIAETDFANFRATLKELGRQLLESRTGMIRLNWHSHDEWLAHLGWANHPMGTTRMSADPKTGVVDATLKVHGVGNLYVASSSVFPTYGATDPFVTLIALSLRLADHLKGAQHWGP